MFNKIFWLLVIGNFTLFASGSGTGETDIVPRSVNFLIFAAMVYYLLADFLKNFFEKRRVSILHELEKVQERLKESKVLKENAYKKVEESKKIAEDIIATAKKEAVLISTKINENMQQDISALERIANEQIETEKRRVVRETVKDVLTDMFKDGGFSVNDKEFVNIILKKVA
ncbi:MAG: F0F1 ATP synthase subunit B [Campylobacterales bacterium]|nr:F0F1 ATP synthase subunit B [Campylobacterales bacterium]